MTASAGEDMKGAGAAQHRITGQLRQYAAACSGILPLPFIISYLVYSKQTLSIFLIFKMYVLKFGKFLKPIYY